MVQMSILGKLRQSPEKAAAAAAAAVIEDELEEEHGPLNKRSKPSPNQQRGSETGMVPQSIPYILLDEPSPLGLRLRKSPSLLDLIQMRLSLGCSASSSCITSSEYIDAGKKELQSTAVSGIPDKLKASNFRASLLKIGSWECISRYEGDLVAKCYYAKHKLVWEVLDGGLKNKIELQWSDIASLKATCPENGPGTLDIVLAQQPLFFRETNPQPRKHTLWQATSDFTNGQASTHRRHFLQCPQGLLNKHFEKLIQCDPRLNSLSQQSEIILEPPFFEPRLSCVFENPVEDSKCHGFDLKGGYHDPLSAGFQDPLSSSSEPPSASSSCKNEIMRAPFGSGDNDVPLCKALSPSSVMDTEVVDKNPTTSRILNHWDQIKVPGLHSSMSMSDLVNHIGHCISGQTTPGNPLLPTNSSLNKSVLEELTQYLLSDSQVTSANDEQSLMSRVNSLCCLIQHKDPQTVQLNTSDDADESDDSDDEKDSERKKVDTNNDASGCKLGMSRKDSYGELLLNLPRISSMPQFLFNIAEDSENQAR